MFLFFLNHMSNFKKQVKFSGDVSYCKFRDILTRNKTILGRLVWNEDAV